MSKEEKKPEMVMLYGYPATLKTSNEKKGVVKVGKEEFDYIVVSSDEVEACVAEGYGRTYAEAKEGSSGSDLTAETFTTLTVDEIKEQYTLDDFKAFCKAQGIKGYSKLKEDEILNLILENINPEL